METNNKEETTSTDEGVNTGTELQGMESQVSVAAGLLIVLLVIILGSFYLFWESALTKQDVPAETPQEETHTDGLENNETQTSEVPHTSDEIEAIEEDLNSSLAELEAELEELDALFEEDLQEQ